MNEHSPTQTSALSPEVVTDDETPPAVSEPAKLIRIASMTRAMLEEVRQAPLDDAGRERLRDVHHRSLDQLSTVLSPELAAELETIFAPVSNGDASESELRLVQAQLVGWLEGLFHGIQASLWSQQMSAAAQLEEMRGRHALDGGDDGSVNPGQYL